MTSSARQNIDPEPAEGGTVQVLVPRDQTRGATNHLPDSSGAPLCKTNIKRSLWQIEERSLETTFICNRCRHTQAKISRS
jgi:hypothetical protein